MAGITREAGLGALELFVAQFAAFDRLFLVAKSALEIAGFGRGRGQRVDVIGLAPMIEAAG